MKILILCDRKVSGHTPALQGSFSPVSNPRSWEDLAGKAEELMLQVGFSSAPHVWEVKWDIIIVYNALEMYLANRFKIKGRPWVCCASFCFEDTHTFYRSSVPIGDMGLDVIFTNCRPFIERSAPHIPTLFLWPPMGIEESGSSNLDSYKIGAYITDVMDRDFSLLELCYTLLESKDLEGNIVAYALDPEEVRRVFPDAAFTEALLPGANPYQHLLAYVPTPRVSDILFGVVDAEMLTALGCMCFPIVMHHNKFPQLKEWVKPSFDSISGLEQVLVDICEGKLDRTVKVPFNVHAVDMEFVEAVKKAYKRKKAHAAT